MGNNDYDAAFLPLNGYVSGRYSHAHHCCSSLCSLVIKLGFNPIWYVILYTITCQIAYLTPPFGYNLFLMRAMAPKEITLGDIYRSVVPFVLLMILGLALVMIFPQ